MNQLLQIQVRPEIVLKKVFKDGYQRHIHVQGLFNNQGNPPPPAPVEQQNTGFPQHGNNFQNVPTVMHRCTMNPHDSQTAYNANATGSNYARPPAPYAPIPSPAGNSRPSGNSPNMANGSAHPIDHNPAPSPLPMSPNQTPPPGDPFMSTLSNKLQNVADNRGNNNNNNNHHHSSNGGSAGGGDPFRAWNASSNNNNDNSSSNGTNGWNGNGGGGSNDHNSGGQTWDSGANDNNNGSQTWDSGANDNNNGSQTWGGGGSGGSFENTAGGGGNW